VNTTSVRHLSRALAIGALAALVIDALLRNALAAVQSPGVSSMTPWWITGRVSDRAVWVVAALLMWLTARTLAPVTKRLWPVDHLVTRSAAFDVVGGSMIIVPLVWMLASLLVLAARITLAGSWELDGPVLLMASYYNNVVLGYLPWAGSGSLLLMLGRHASD
jgi:hypothetical protein